LAFVSKPPPKGKAGARIVVAIYDHRATDENELSFAGTHLFNFFFNSSE
jgi:hypothetical protein